MANDSITFSCPACGIRLTVPGNLAGVSGPCPSCRAPIQAPAPSPTAAREPIAVQPVGPSQPIYSPQQPVYQQPIYQEPVQTPPPQQHPSHSYPQQAAYSPPLTPRPAPPVDMPQQALYPPLAPTTTDAPPQPGQGPPPHRPEYYQQSPPLPPQDQATSYQSPPPVPRAIYTPPPPPQYLDYAVGPVAASAPVATRTATETPVETVSQAPAVLRPEPRQLPSRSAQGEQLVAKQMPESNRSSGTLKANPLPRHPHQRRPLVRSLIAILFLVAAIGIVSGVRSVLNNQTEDPRGANRTKSTVLTILPENEPPPKKPMVEESVPSLPVPQPEQPSIIEPAPTLPEGMEPETPGKAANDVLEKFLAAKSLTERLAMIETKTADSELLHSCLASPLPAASNILTEAQESNAVERVTDIYYNVDFDAGNNTRNPQTILVRTRGTEAPKIVADPFLDSYGGRLAAYAAKPSEKSGVFQVIISAVASCNDERVPNREKKLTLKLLPRDNTKEIARAYFGRQSKIGMMLEDGTYSLSYGKAKACTVLLRWNTEDNPATPYLEAIDLKRLDWNP